MDGQQTHPVVDRLRHAVDTLMSTELAVLASAQVTALLADLEVQRRRLEAVDQLVVAEIDQRGLAGDYARATTAQLLTQLLRVSPGEAAARVGRARDLGPRRGLSGEPLDPIVPIAAAAVADGEISSAHVGVIVKCLDEIPPSLAYEVSPVAEGMLVEAARHEDPAQLRKTAALLLARIDPDGAEPRDDEIERRREFGLQKHRDGSATPTGRFTAEVTAMWEAVFDSLAAPQSSSDGGADTRTGGQRRHDAAAEVLQRVLRSGTLPETGGVPVTVLIRTSLADLRDRSGVAVTAGGAAISIGTMLDMSGEATLLSVVCSDTGGVLSYGRERRLASRGQRLALAARDGGCAFPGCDRPAAWTEVHHIKDWLYGGCTDIANMCLLCRYHHRHFAAAGWEVFISGALPWWRPPSWIDPDRRPIRNTAHHLDDITFEPVA
jgi:hypothetical protein